MFEVEYKGGNAVIFTTKNIKLVFDPNLASAGVKGANSPGVKDAIEVVTEPRFALTDQESQLLFEGPGEYEVGDVTITGLAAQRHIDTEADGKKSTIYRITIGDTAGVVIGNIGERISDDQYEKIGMVDFVIIPVGGGGYTLDATGATNIVRQISPKVVIPVHYADSSLVYEVPQAELEEFVNKLGANVVEAGAKWKFKSASDLPEHLTIVQIARS